MVNSVIVKGDVVILSKYEIMKAFFKTEDEDNDAMAVELNRLINVFYKEEHSKKKNITELPFNVKENETVIEYIKNVLLNQYT